jgi:hypothetical protein
VSIYIDGNVKFHKEGVDRGSLRKIQRQFLLNMAGDFPFLKKNDATVWMSLKPMQKKSKFILELYLA